MTGFVRALLLFSHRTVIKLAQTGQFPPEEAAGVLVPRVADFAAVPA
jgi:hypothetical protein